MKRFTLIMAFFLTLSLLQAQDYQISFTGNETISSVKVENLTQETEMTLSSVGDVLHLLGTTTGVEQVINKNLGLRVYPNPMTEASSIEFNATVSGLASISVFDITGKQVISEQRNLAVGSHVFKLNNLSTGIYTLSVKSDSYLYSAKLVSQSIASGTASLSYVSKSALKSSKSVKDVNLVEMQYNADDRLLITATSGTMSTVKSMVYTDNATETFDFVACTDGDGTHYPTVKIGAQVWMAKNLNTSKYSNGDAIGDKNGVYTNDEWKALGSNDTDKGFCYYDVTDNENGAIYGALYTYAAATNGIATGTNVQGACPTGWHLPSDAEWTTLTDGLSTDEGGKLKATTTWNDPNTGATNSSGFSALSGGYRNYLDGAFYSVGYGGYWWSATESSSSFAWYRLLSCSNAQVSRDYGNKSGGFSVRCVRN